MTKRVIGFHYTLTDKTGTVLDSSIGDEPLYFLEGSQQTTKPRATAACHRIGRLSVLKAASSPAAHFKQD